MAGRNRTNNDPREITVRYAGKCAETGVELKKGDRAIYYPDGKKLYSLQSKQAEEFRNWRFDESVLGASY